ncbi:MAG: nicotinate (nicotinamide) nucleotide adenylyltransferase [Candidatus Krumholzibacteriota bacterium]|nr:nicotinate (nicotinamide) nucleotide adenylyltransferase [Candidatus Krumholzibacteriota bacterium]
MKSRERIGLFGGSFDPVHTGHLILAEMAAEAASLDRVLFIPTSNPPHKSAGRMSSFSDRKIMVELAIAGNERFFISDLEDRGDISYTFESILHFREKGFGRDQIHLIIGADSLNDITRWRNPEEILSNATIIAMQRPGHTVNSPLPSEAAIIFLTGASNSISSSGIRKRVAERKSIRYLVPESVARYIEERSLYIG